MREGVLRACHKTELLMQYSVASVIGGRAFLTVAGNIATLLRRRWPITIFSDEARGSLISSTCTSMKSLLSTMANTP